MGALLESGRGLKQVRRPLLGAFTLLLLVGCTRAASERAHGPSELAANDGTPQPAAAPATAAQAPALALETDDGSEIPLAEPVVARDMPGEKSKDAASGLPTAAASGAGAARNTAPERVAASKRALPRSKTSLPLGGAALQPAPAPKGPLAQQSEDFNTEGYAPVVENSFLAVKSQPLSTFSVDVDTASYSNSRRFLTQGSLPPKDAIRVEEWLNYFAYDYPAPTGDTPFAVNTEVTSCPWNSAHRLVRIGIKGREIREENVPARNLVFLLDVSGSMMPPDKLPLVKRGLALLTDSLRPQDSLAMVVYAGSSGLVLPPTSGAERGKILRALDSLEAGGSTNGGEGIELAYRVAQQQLRKSGINRVILATDGDFNVGTTSEGELTRLIEEKRKSGVFLTVLGFGTGNVKDSTMEMLADKGNGNYAYIDTLAEARKVLVREAGSTLVTIAKDVKLQVEFNPLRVGSYKLLGYENRVLAKEAFNDDTKDAGEIGAGHTVTALYEIVPSGALAPRLPAVDPLKYQGASRPSSAASSNELLTVSVRYKAPQADTSTKFSVVVGDAVTPIERASDDYRFGVAVVNAALLLRGSSDIKQSSLDAARALAAGAIGRDPQGDRREFVALLDQARRLRGEPSATAQVVAR